MTILCDKCGKKLIKRKPNDLINLTNQMAVKKGDKLLLKTTKTIDDNGNEFWYVCEDCALIKDNDEWVRIENNTDDGWISFEKAKK